MDEPTTQPATTAPAARPLDNSVWCTDRAGRLGMIAEINGGEAMFYYEGRDGALETEATMVPVEQLTRAPAAKVPARLDFTPQQLADQGYL